MTEMIEKSSVLNVNNISFKYPNFELKNISFSISSGEIVVFIGQNGAGKTTTIKCITGQILSDTGDIKVLNCDLRKTPDLYKSHTAYVCEETSIYDSLTPLKFKNIFKRFYPNWDEEIYAKLIDVFNLDQNKKISEYSKGMKMKFHLAFALSHHADVLILDEPTSGLDPFIRSDFLQIIEDEAKKGTAVLFSTHIVEEALKIADRLIFISGGEIKFDLPSYKIDESLFIIEADDYACISKLKHKILKRNEYKYLVWIDREAYGFDISEKNKLIQISLEETMKQINGI